MSVQRGALWETKIPRSIQEVVRGGTGCISMRGDERTSSRKTILSAFDRKRERERKGEKKRPSVSLSLSTAGVHFRCLVAQVALCNP